MNAPSPCENPVDQATVEADPAPFLLAALNASSIAALVFDEQQRVLFANPAARLFAKMLNPQDQGALTHVADWHRDLLPPAGIDTARRTEEVMIEVGGEKKYLLVEISALGPDPALTQPLAVPVTSTFAPLTVAVIAIQCIPSRAPSAAEIASLSRIGSCSSGAAADASLESMRRAPIPVT